MLSMRCSFLLAFVVATSFGIAWSAADESELHKWTIDNVERQALVYVPERAQTEASPVLFAFHGHGGTMQHAARTFAYHKHWPEAICIYMQGLNTPGKLTDPEGKKPGWQSSIGDQSDRDLKFFDAVLSSLKAEAKVDEKRIYATGHSNGGGFTYLLWQARDSVFAAVAPSAASSRRMNASQITPKPFLHVAGTNDPLVKFEWQAGVIEAIKKFNSVVPEGKPWRSSGQLKGTIYESPNKTPVITLLHEGGHKFLSDEAPPLIVSFFKDYAKP